MSQIFTTTSGDSYLVLPVKLEPVSLKKFKNGGMVTKDTWRVAKTDNSTILHIATVVFFAF